VWEVHLAKLELFPGIRLHRLQTPTPLPQPEIPEYMHHLDNIALQSEIQQIRVAPFRKPNDTPRETGNGEPGTGWAYSSMYFEFVSIVNYVFGVVYTSTVFTVCALLRFLSLFFDIHSVCL
jgi:hypothetical protein